MKYHALVCLFLFFSIVTLWGQDIVIIGQVMSGVDGTPLEAANVWFKGTDLGTTTNQDGFFMLRSPVPQSSVIVSMVGFKRRTMRLENGKDQMLEIYLREDVTLLDEILLMPGENPANRMIREVIEHKRENDPDLMVEISFQSTEKTTLDLTTLKQKIQQRRLLKELTKGDLSADDSTLIIPVYYSEIRDSVVITSDSVSETTLFQKEKGVDMFTTDQWQSYIDNYVADANFYKDYIILFDKAFVSPLSANAQHFYSFLLSDSVVQNSDTLYEITYYPKNENLFVFRGKMWIDDARHALVSVHAELPITSHLNYVNALNFDYTYVLFADRYYYKSKRQSASFRVSQMLQSKTHFGALLVKETDYSPVTLLSEQVQMTSLANMVDSSKLEYDTRWQLIDSINQTRIQKLASSISDLVINGYAHIWKFDLGPLMNFFNYNSLEGARPIFSLRTGEALWPNVTIGGYGGYGFTDHRWKYGGELQWRFGEFHKHTLSAFYDRRIFRYGFDQVNIYQENKVEQYDHLFNWLYTMKLPAFNALRERATLQYRYEKDGVRLIVAAHAERTFSQDFIPFIQQGKSQHYVSSADLYADFRISWKEQTLDNYFRRHYLRSNYPIIHLISEAGYYSVGDREGPYGRLQLVVKQRFPFIYGKLSYTLDAACILGNVPFTKLSITRGTRSWYYTHSNFALLSQAEFCADKYIGGHFRYESSGLLLNLIPYVKKLNIRENVLFNIGYGSLNREKHDKVLVVPMFMKSFTMPYMEFGIGLSNIFHFITIESVWRLTYRHHVDGPLWGIRGRFDLNF